MSSRALGAADAQAPLAPRAKATLALEILVAYARARYLLSRGTFPQAVATLRDVPVTKDSPADPVRGGRRLGSAVVRTLRVLPTDSRCLVRSLVLTRILSRRGVASTLVIGVNPGDRFEAHAWVEHEGSALLDAGESSFHRLAEL